MKQTKCAVRLPRPKPAILLDGMQDKVVFAGNLAKELAQMMDRDPACRQLRYLFEMATIEASDLVRAAKAAEEAKRLTIN